MLHYFWDFINKTIHQRKYWVDESIMKKIVGCSRTMTNSISSSTHDQRCELCKPQGRGHTGLCQCIKNVLGNLKNKFVNYTFQFNTKKTLAVLRRRRCVRNQLCVILFHLFFCPSWAAVISYVAHWKVTTNKVKPETDWPFKREAMCETMAHPSATCLLINYNRHVCEYLKCYMSFLVVNM